MEKPSARRLANPRIRTIFEESARRRPRETIAKVSTRRRCHRRSSPEKLGRNVLKSRSRIALGRMPVLEHRRAAGGGNRRGGVSPPHPCSVTTVGYETVVSTPGAAGTFLLEPLGGHRVGLRRMNRSLLVLEKRIHRDDLQVFVVVRVHEVVLRSGGHETTSFSSTSRSRPAATARPSPSHPQARSDRSRGGLRCRSHPRARVMSTSWLRAPVAASLAEIGAAFAIFLTSIRESISNSFRRLHGEETTGPPRHDRVGSLFEKRSPVVESGESGRAPFRSQITLPAVGPTRPGCRQRRPATCRQPTRANALSSSSSSGTRRFRSSSFLLQEAGFRVEFASNGQEALDRARTDRPYLLVTEILVRRSTA